ncbi:hypothetical protein N7457_002899 [Penicillium paradoxum]|uniref:uncharacterized protein n=1 Tax=Penicillium paradoxum TaxID=176176 RepID=UPI0025485E7B|nr:uncharacterized protein N7457_002899 [Penicillium paradoxum]KAJ5787909.1 hypothetical protein N7457_002899 [Penicillium paradoxum]
MPSPPPQSPVVPSPIHPLPRITADLATNAKRNLTSAQVHGAKTRNVEYLVDAQFQHCTALISIGVQSNYTPLSRRRRCLGRKPCLMEEYWVDAEYGMTGDI